MLTCPHKGAPRGAVVVWVVVLTVVVAVVFPVVVAFVVDLTGVVGTTDVVLKVDVGGS